MKRTEIKDPGSTAAILAIYSEMRAHNKAFKPDPMESSISHEITDTPAETLARAVVEYAERKIKAEYADLLREARGKAIPIEDWGGGVSVTYTGSSFVIEDER